MEQREFKKLKKKSYDGVVRYLIKKYGKIKGDYFIYKNGRYVKNDKLYKDGLFIHHIKEVLYTDLSNPNHLGDRSYHKSITKEKQLRKYQKGRYLVYCDYLEHALLHQKIIELKDYQNKKYYVNGLVGYLIPELNDFFSHIINAYNQGVSLKMRPFYKRIVNDYDVYTQLLGYIIYRFENYGFFNNIDILNKSTNLPLRFEDLMIKTTGSVRSDIFEAYNRIAKK